MARQAIRGIRKKQGKDENLPICAVISPRHSVSLSLIKKGKYEASCKLLNERLSVPLHRQMVE